MSLSFQPFAELCAEPSTRYLACLQHGVFHGAGPRCLRGNAMGFWSGGVAPDSRQTEAQGVCWILRGSYHAGHSRLKLVSEQLRMGAVAGAKVADDRNIA